MKFEEQQYLQSLERCLRYIRSGERLSIEASIEELCKVLLLQICFERNGDMVLRREVLNMMLTDEQADSFYQKHFNMHVPGYDFRGWENLRIGKSTFSKVVEELTHDSLFESKPDEKARAFTEFLQIHYSGYLSEYSTPQALSKYIMEVINHGNLTSLADPCCGLGGFLVEAIGRNTSWLQVKGFDVNRRMVNTANLHMMFYGHQTGNVECLDMLEMASVYKEGSFDAVVSHLPQRLRVFSIAGKKRDSLDSFSSKIQEDVFIGQILKMLKPHGVAALVVSDELLMSDRRAESRKWLYKNAQVLNITRFDGLSYSGSSNVRSYNVMFLRRLDNPTSDVCSATLFKAGTDELEIKKAAEILRMTIYAETPDIPNSEHLRYFRLLESEVWNVALLFAREKMGARYPTRLLKDIMVHDRQRVRVKDAWNYKQLTVKSKGLGVVDRKVEYVGKPSSNNVRYAARSGQIIISSLEADKGAIGIVPKELNNALVSRNYYLFTIISQDVDPDYLVLVLSSEPVLKQLEFHKRGYIMSRISIKKIMSVVIPLPSLEEQKMLVKNLMRKVKRVQAIQTELEEEQKTFAIKLFGE